MKKRNVGGGIWSGEGNGPWYYVGDTGKKKGCINERGYTEKQHHKVFAGVIHGERVGAYMNLAIQKNNVIRYCMGDTGRKRGCIHEPGYTEKQHDKGFAEMIQGERGCIHEPGYTEKQHDKGFAEMIHGERKGAYMNLAIQKISYGYDKILCG